MPSEEHPLPVHPWLIAGSVMLATFMEVLDTTVVTVAMPHMAGSLSASTDEVTWVVTSYLVSNAVVLPASGWLARYFGRKRLLITCITIFTIASLLCGLAPTLGLLVLARVLQGVGGGALQPLAQSIMLESFPREKRGAAMAAYGMGVVVAPIFGPLVGGWITDHYSWSWIFYINLPVGFLAISMISRFVHDPSYITEGNPGRIDVIGFGLMTLAIVSLQMILDRGQEDDWMAATWIRWAAGTGAFSFFAFLWWENQVESPIVDLRVFRNRNFAVGTFLITIVGVAVYSPLTLIPQFLQNLLGYTALTSGLTQAPRGFGSIAGMILVGYLTSRVDNRYLIGIAFALVGVSTFLISNIDLEVTQNAIRIPYIFSGFCTALVFVPLTTTTMSMLRNAQMGNASGIYNLMRNIGGSIGVSLTATLVTRGEQAHQATLITHLTPYDAAFTGQMHTWQTVLTAAGVPASSSSSLALGEIYQTVLRQATLLSYVDAFRWLALMCVVCSVTVVLFKKVHRHAPVLAH
jgi:DHA2 family multidrug resistance protein